MDLGRTAGRALMAALLGVLLAAGGCSSGEGGGAAPRTPPPESQVPDGEVGMVAPVTRETVVLAGGCFWGMEEILRAIPGVLETEVGYSGGEGENATYAVVKTGRTGHAESVLVTYDPSRLSFEALLGWFFRMHDPTTRDRQGNDVGTQYRSAIFWTTEAQREVAERVKRAVDASGKWKAPVVTEIRRAGPWSRAEEYHQDYLQKNPDGYTCHWLRD